MNTITRCVILLTVAIVIAGCHSWKREMVTPFTSYEASRVRLRADGAPMLLEDVRVQGDSLRGTRQFARQPAESVAVALTSIGSLEAWRTDAGKIAGLVAGVAAPVVFVVTRPCFVLRPCNETPPWPL